MSAEFRPQDEYLELTGGLSSAELFEGLQDSPPPPDLQPLPLDDQLARRLRLPLINQAEVPVLRRAVTRDLMRIVSDPSNGLNADVNTVYDLRQGLSEGIQNSFRNNQGVWQIDLSKTPEGGLYTAVHNIAVTYPDEPVFHEWQGRGPLRLNRRRAMDQPHESLPDDEHGWGLGLIGRFAMNGSFTSMGFYKDEIARIPVRGQERHAAITRLVFWSMYARSELEYDDYAKVA